MKIYVAGKWGDKESISKRMVELKDLGHEITHDWTTNDQGKSKSAVLDINGVQQADFIIVIADDPGYEYRGTFCEIGCALGLKKKVYVYSPNVAQSKFFQVCFAHHPLVSVFTDWSVLLRKINNIVVFIESPYSGRIDLNIRYLMLCHIDCSLLRGEIPYSSHSYMTQHPRCKNIFVSDYDSKWDTLTRDEAIVSSQAIRERCNLTVFYTDLGWSNGMKAAKEYCQTHNLPFEERTLRPALIAAKVPFISEEFCRAIISNQDYQIYLE